MPQMTTVSDRVLRTLRAIPDYPKPGILFQDITPVLADGELLREVVADMCRPFGDAGVTQVLGIEARGFILASPVAYHFGAGFVPVRKAGKLPWDSESASYELEYGQETLEIHKDALAPGERVLIVDDVLATGGTAAATASLVERLGAKVMGIACLIELGALHGRDKLKGHDFFSLIAY